MQNWINEPSNSLFVLGDFNASYYLFPYQVIPDKEIVIRGQFPHARYLSFTINGQGDVAIASVPDVALIPDPGSTNPFLPGANWDAKNRNYTLLVRFTAPPPGFNHFVPGAGTNTVYAGTLPDGRLNSQGLITLRIYVPSIGYDQTGGVGLPTIEYCNVKADMVNISELDEKPSISDITPDTLALPNNNNCTLVWSKTNRLQSILLQANPNTIYLISNQLQRDPGKLLFIRFKAPTFPDTYHNFGIVGNEDMRYWSFMFTTRIGYLGLYTISDFQTHIDKYGYVNLVISFGAERPKSVTADNGYTWVNVSHLPLISFSLIYRNTLISPNFPFVPRNVPEGEIVPPEVMGEYYPCGIYVDPSYFDVCR